jgi:hypothetical protein
MLGMEIDPLPEDVRQYLRQHFSEVNDELPQGDSYVFSMKLASGERREIKVHRELSEFSGVIAAYLNEHNFAARLERGNVEISEPLRG